MKQLLPILILFGAAQAQTVVNIRSVPSEADVFLDSIEIGKTPIDTIKIDTGRHTLKFAKKGFVQSEGELVIAAGKQLDIDVRLVPLHSVFFRTDEEDLVFEWDGKHKWTHSSITFEMQEGIHTLRVFRNRNQVEERLVKNTRPMTMEYALPPDSARMDSLDISNISIEE